MTKGRKRNPQGELFTAGRQKPTGKPKKPNILWEVKVTHPDGEVNRQRFHRKSDAMEWYVQAGRHPRIAKRVLNRLKMRTPHTGKSEEVKRGTGGAKMKPKPRRKTVPKKRPKTKAKARPKTRPKTKAKGRKKASVFSEKTRRNLSRLAKGRKRNKKGRFV